MGNSKNSTRYYLFREKTRISTIVNILLYFIKSFPFLGKKISPHIYRNYELKDTLFNLGIVIYGIYQIGTRFLSITLAGVFFTFLSAAIYEDFTILSNINEIVQASILIWLTVALLFWNVNTIIQPHVNQYVLQFVDNFKIDKKIFIRYKSILDSFINALYYIPVAITMSWLLNSWIVAITVPLLSVSTSLAGHNLSRRIKWKLSQNNVIASTIYVIFIIFIIIGSVLLPIFTDSTWFHNIISHWSLIVISLIIGGISYKGITNFKDEDRYLAELIDRSTGIIMTVANVHSDQMRNEQKKLTLTKINKNHHKKRGNIYLNALLFDRYKKEFSKIIKLRLLLSLAIIAIFLIGFFGFREIFEDTIELAQLIQIVFIPVWISMLAVGRKIVLLVYTNCDSAMLNYAFYKTRKVIVTGFIYRTLKTLKLNSVLALAPMFIILTFAITDQDFSKIIPTILILFTFLILFSFHELFLYYLLQPYAENMQIKSPIYFILTFLSSFIIWFFIGGMDRWLQTLYDQKYVLIFTLLAITMVYILIGGIIIYYFGTKTFKTRN